MQEGQKPGQKRNDIARSKGFRKFVITTMINHRINETIRNLLTDHSIDIDKNYYCPTEQDMLAEYLKVVGDLTINDSNRWKRKVEQLTVRADKLDQLAAQVARLSKRMGLVELEQISTSPKEPTLDNLTEELKDNLGYME